MQAAAYSDRSKAIHIWARALWLAGLVACFWFAGCGQSAGTGPEAEKLRKEMSRTLGGLGEKVEPLLAKGDVDGIDYLLKEKLNAAAKAGKSVGYALAVLSDEGRVVAGRYPEPDGKNHRKTRNGFNFGQYDSFKKVLGGKSAGCLLYTPQGTMYAMCMPLRNGRRVIGMVCVGYPEDEFKRKYNLDQDEFLSVNFD